MHQRRSANWSPIMVAAVALVFALTVGAGCAQTAPPHSNAAQSAVPAAKPTDPPAPSTPAIAAVASQVQMSYRDPKTGKLLWKANVRSLEAQSPGSGQAGVMGTLHVVDGILYQTGTPADRMLAPTVNIDQTNKIITASGGVHVISLTHPNTDLHCNRVVWNAATNKLVGRGNVIFRNGTFTQTGPSFAADTRLKSVLIPDPSESANDHTAGSGKIQAKFE